MATKHYKLYYFNAMGRAETIRLLFAHAGIPYEDVRVEREQWPSLKSTMPFGQLPVLEVDGKQLAQSHAIEKYLARSFGLDGNDEWHSAKIDELLMGVEDLLQKMAPWLREQSEAKKIEIFKTLVENEITPFLQRYERFLLENNTGFFVGNQVTLADLCIFHLLWFLNTKLLPGHLKKYEHLDQFVTKIAGLANIKQWLSTRPKTDS